MFALAEGVGFEPSPRPRNHNEVPTTALNGQADRQKEGLESSFREVNSDPRRGPMFALAEGVGFEPTEVLPQRFSRPSPSSARPSLQGVTSPLPSLVSAWPSLRGVAAERVGFEPSPRSPDHGKGPSTHLSPEPAGSKNCPRIGARSPANSWASRRGESGIRTHGTPNRIQRFSRPSPSSTRPSLRVTTLSSTGRIVISPAYCHQSDRLAASARLVTHRRTSKKSSSNLRASASRTPTTTSQRWLSRSSCGMLNRLHTPPAFRSGAA